MVSPPALDLILYRRFLLALSVACTSGAGAQATPTVAPNDPIYGFIDRLVAARLVDTIILGQRPISRREIGRLLAEARSRNPTGWLRERIDEWRGLYPDSMRKAPLTSTTEFETTVSESPARGIAPDGNGSIDVALNPLLGNRLGRDAVNGVSAGVFGEGGGSLGRHFALAGRYGFVVSGERGGSGTAHETRIERYAIRGLWKNAALSVGRDYFVLGQGETAGLTNSLNSPALDAVRISSDRPFRLPWVLGVAGPIHATAVLADLGSDQHFPHARLFAYKASMRPHRLFEIGTSFAEQVGGEGSPPGTLLQKAGDAFPLLDALVLHRNFHFSNKLIGVDLRYTLPYVRGVQFYAEGAFDDFDFRRTRSTFTEDAAYVWGLSASCFAECGPVRATAEYHVTGLRFYTHVTYQNGYTIRDRLIGDQLGPRGRGGYGSLELARSPSLGVNLDVAYEARSGNKYGATSTTPDDSDFRFVILERHPTERRLRGVATVRLGKQTTGTSARFTAGAERAENFAHVYGASKLNWLEQIGIEIRDRPRPR